MLALIISLTMGLTDLSVLAVPVIPPDPKEIWLDKLMACESMGSTTVRVLEKNGTYSTGLFQFSLKTWLSYGKKFGATEKNIYDGELQRIVVRDMLDKGLKNHWYHCSKRVEKILGVY